MNDIIGRDGLKKEDSDAKHRVKKVALSLFSEQGFPNVSVRDIMTACGLTSGAMYAHYRSKEELLFSLINEGHAQLYMRLDALYRLRGSSPERLARLAYVHMAFQLTNLELARIASNDYRYLAVEMREEITTLRRKMTDFFDLTLKKGIEEGVFDIQMLLPTRMALISPANTAPEWFQLGKTYSPTELARWHATLVLRLVMAGTESTAQNAKILDSALQTMDIGWSNLLKLVSESKD